MMLWSRIYVFLVPNLGIKHESHFWGKYSFQSEHVEFVVMHVDDKVDYLSFERAYHRKMELYDVGD